MKPTYVHREKPDAYLFLGVVMRVLLTSEDTGGQFTMIEGTMPPEGDGGLHVHRDEDESMTLLEGALDVTVGDVNFRLEAGQSYFAPRGVPHRLRNTGTLPARGLLVTTPGGFDSFVARAGIPVHNGVVPILPPPSPEGMGALLELAAQYGITVLEPPAGLPS
ncbi:MULTISPECIES: cupin domain-containing protein [unclassified Rhizobium]|uniref:cupin domain-containing protein n=1 Tax=unclassified Rhizobium TaxID=2613769 RepID=UPI001AD99D10|nr:MULTISPECIES: cupin domain-containing protein [unclassified Rhizobium]MBO9097682.1 cupin domain-containing protein [Rhizobium sp. L58/93]MBO9133534.1 cupin domain-containing protein [Rhizobium sp. B209b/85]MBO9167832.1 cupin domain-containing protein [Rhizobium sp. L245/93]MBO9183877.1 cupin domain-containing protein [Rhizobium sp. E27B/91]QXZ84119.1 cupin domain-containing protein [Rhizobium sp. K1/93]